MVIRLVIFDLDDVLARLDRPRRLDYLAAATGRNPEHFNATIWHSDFEPAAEAGAYPTGAEYLAEFNRRSGCSLTRKQWVEARRQAMTVLPGSLELVRRLRPLTGIAMLTNNGALLRESLPELVPEFCALFGPAAHASCEFQARKPDREVYLRLCARHAVEPGAALMIDDGLGNVRGAREAGLQAVHFRDPAGLEAELGHLGLLRG